MSDVLSDSALATVDSIWNSDDSMAKVQANWEEFIQWCSVLGDRANAVVQMVEQFGEHACMAPASSRVEFHNAFPGGFIDHSLRVMKLSVRLAKTLGQDIPKESLIISGLFHDWGKAGDGENEYYSPQTSDWHRKRGMTYTRNNEIKIPNNAQLGLFSMSQCGIVLSENEYLAILLNDGQYGQSNKEYAMKEPALALIVHYADRWATQCEKLRWSFQDAAEPKF